MGAGGRMKRWVSSLMVGVVGMSLLAAPASANHREDIEGSFTATAFPSAGWSYWLYWVYPSHDFGCGLGNVNYDSHLFEAPARGTLVAQAEFVGDWDLEIVDDQGRVLGGSYSGSLSGPERTSVLLLKGDAVEIRGCNYLGAPQAEITFRFRFAR